MSLRSLLRSVVEWICPPRCVEPELRIAPEQLRAALSEMLADPETRRLVLRDFVGTIFPIAGGQSCTLAKFTLGATGDDGTFGKASGCGPRVYTFESDAVGNIPLSVKGFTGQTADLQQWKKSDETVLTVVDKDGKLGVRTASPIADTNLPVQISTGGAGSVTYFGANKNGAYGALFGFENGGSLGTGGIVRVVPTGDPLMFFVNDNTEAMRITSGGQVGIGTKTPIANADLPVQISTAGAGTKAYYGANKDGGYGALFGFENAGPLGTGGIVRVVQTGDPLMFFVNNTIEAMRIISNGNVGIGRTDPLGKLHAKGGNLYIEGPGSVGRLGFLKDVATSGNDGTHLWRSNDSEAPEKMHLQTQTGVYTLLVIKAPPASLPGTTNREATLALSRDLSNGAEFLDFYNNGYVENIPPNVQYGIRIQRRGIGGQFRDLVFDKKSFGTGTEVPLMRIKTADLGEEVAISTKLSVKAIRAFKSKGKVSTMVNSTTVTGDIDTRFTQEIVVGDVITVVDINETRTVTNIVDDNHLTVDANFTVTEPSSDMTVISASRFPGSESIRTTEGVTTTGGTATTLHSITLENGRAYYIVVRVVGRKSDGADRAFFYRAVLAFNQGAGVVIQGSEDVSTAIKSSGASGWSLTFDFSGNNLLVQVTGAAATTIHWVATIEYQSVATNA